MNTSLLFNDLKIITVGAIVSGSIYYITNRVQYLGYCVGLTLCAIGIYNIIVLMKYIKSDAEQNEEDYEVDEDEDN